MKLKLLLTCVLFAKTVALSGQDLILPNEEIVYCFETKNGKTMMLAKEKTDGYLVYRFGTKNKIDFEFPTKTNDSWNQFRFSYYFRGGGKKNAGTDLNELFFVNGDFKYVIYSSYYAGDDEEPESYDIGVRVVDLKNDKMTVISGKPKTEKGTLAKFRSNGLVEIAEQD